MKSEIYGVAYSDNVNIKQAGPKYHHSDSDRIDTVRGESPYYCTSFHIAAGWRTSLRHVG